VKKIFTIVLSLVLCVGVLAACSDSEGASGSSKDFPSKAINLIVAYDAGGGTDLTARTLQPFLEDELGVTVNVVNKPGGSGWVGWTEIANADPDGYTIGYLNSPNVASGLVNPTLERTIGLEDFVTLANDVADPGAIVIRVDEERFTNFEELVAYAKENELTTTATGVAGDDHLVTLKLNNKLGTKFREIQFEGTAESRTSFLGGHVDVLITSVGEAYKMHQDNQLKVVAVTAPQRSPFLPDVPTVKDAGFAEVISQSTRGIIAPKGLPKEVEQKLKDALEKAINNEEHLQKMKDMGTSVVYSDGEEYLNLLEQDIEDIKDIKDLLGW
jgi:tripartite-type tricarboxylate transporter receptor subunit TctC